MIRLLVVFLSGVVVGAAFVWKFVPTSLPQAVFSPLVMETGGNTCASELEATRVELAELRRSAASTSVGDTVFGTSSQHSVRDVSEPQATSESADSSQSGDVVKWKVSAIERFVPLSDEQRQRLREKFEKEEDALPGEEPGSESLEDIVGEENARFYHQQVKAAFQRVQEEEIDREVVWLSRQLVLTQEQERSMRAVFEVVEKQLAEEVAGDDRRGPRSPQQRVQAMIAENRKRTELRNEQLKPVLSPEQYEAYVRTQAESSAADVELFHN
jgi:hypothetical protein